MSKNDISEIDIKRIPNIRKRKCVIFAKTKDSSANLHFSQ